MRDPWKALALFLALALGLVAVWRLPQDAPGAPPDAADATTDEASAPATAPRDPAAEIVRTEDTPQGAEEGGAAGRVNLLLRLVDPLGAVVDGYCSARLPGGERIEPVLHPGALGFYGLPPGPMELVVEQRGFLRQRESVELPPFPELQRHEIALTPSAQIPVYFRTPDGGRLSAAIRARDPYAPIEECLPSILATRDEALPLLPPTRGYGYSSPHARWDGRGFLGGEEAADGTLSLWTPPPLTLHVLLRNLPLAIHPLPAPVDRIEIVLDPEALLAMLGSVRARFVEADGSTAIRAGYPSLMGSRAGHNLIPVGEEGVFERNSLPPGIYELYAHFGERGSFRMQVPLGPGEQLDLGTLRLQRPSALRIQVRAAGPVPESGMEIRIRHSGPALQLTTVGAIGMRFDASGQAELPLLPGAYSAAVIPPADSGWAAAGARLDAPSAAPVVVELRRGALVTLRGREAGLVSYRLWVLVDGHAACGDWNYSEQPRRIRLPPGEHAWVLADPSGAEALRGAILVTAQDQEIRLEVPLP